MEMEGGKRDREMKEREGKARDREREEREGERQRERERDRTIAVINMQKLQSIYTSRKTHSMNSLWVI